MERVIYFIKSNKGYIKIGITNNPQRRLKALQASNFSSLELLAWFPGDYQHEKKVHDHFSCLRKTGEWFVLNKFITDFIDDLSLMKSITFDEQKCPICQKTSRYSDITWKACCLLNYEFEWLDEWWELIIENQYVPCC